MAMVPISNRASRITREKDDINDGERHLLGPGESDARMARALWTRSTAVRGRRCARRGNFRAGDCPAARTGTGRGPGRLGGLACDGIRRAAAEFGADAEPGTACRNQYCAALGAAGAGCILVRP